MRKLPTVTTLRTLINEMLDTMQIGIAEVFEIGDINISSFKQIYYQCTAAHPGEWLSTHDKVNDTFTIIRLK